MSAPVTVALATGGVIGMSAVVVRAPLCAVGMFCNPSEPRKSVNWSRGVSGDRIVAVRFSDTSASCSTVATPGTPAGSCRPGHDTSHMYTENGLNGMSRPGMHSGLVRDSAVPGAPTPNASTPSISMRKTSRTSRLFVTSVGVRSNSRSVML